MPDNSTLFIYGALEATGVIGDALSMIFHNKSIKGYWLSNELKTKSFFTLFGYFGYLKKNLSTILSSKVRKTYELE